MPQSIFTKYVGPTNTKGAKVKAWTSAGLSAVINYPYEDDTEQAHARAVEALLKKHGLKWGQKFAVGAGYGKGFDFVFIPVDLRAQEYAEF